MATIAVYFFFVATVSGGQFTTVAATTGWLDTSAELGILAIPVALLLIAGEFDLSIGSIVGSSSMTVAVADAHYGIALWASILLALALGAAVGLLNGILTVKTGLTSFIVTLATNFGLLGLGLGLSAGLTGTSQVSFNASGTLLAVFAHSWGQFNVSILWWLGLAAIGGWVLARTVFGNWIYAAGGNDAAARSAGVPVDAVKIRLFILTGLGAALVGVIQACQGLTGNPTFGQGYLFEAPVAAVIGGVLLGGGYGSIAGVMLGTAIYGIIDIGIFYTGWDSDWLQLILGVLLLLAVVTNNFFRRLVLTGRLAR